VRLVRYGARGRERPGLLDSSDTVRDLSALLPDIAGEALSAAGLERLARLDPGELPAVPQPCRLGPPLAGIGKIIGVGLNYRDHAEECRLPLPTEPTLFLKATSALSGPDDDVPMPLDGRDLDWEVELAVVIGRPGVYIGEREALDHVAGYCVGIDFSEREFQFRRGGQGFKGKSADGFGPLGPWLVPASAVSDPAALTLRLAVNGETRQDGRTADMLFSVPQLIAYVSRFMSLQAGDVILTGTPAGVGMGRTPPTYLRVGDTIEATIEGLGTQRHVVVEHGVPGGMP
jgi:2-keto-4-pentenoate hydratase/2-oxohepta-3-ene-1,7-dioic acid hydratase in catechol pathway